MRICLSKNAHIYMIMLGMTLIFLAQPYKLAQVVSLGTTIITGATLFALLVIFLLRGIRKPVHGFGNEDVLTLLFLLSASLAFIYAGQYSYSRIVPMVCFLELPILMNSVSVSTQRIRKAILGVFYVLSVYCIIISGTSLAYQYSGEYGIAEIEDLTLGLPNPNQTAMYLMAVFFVLCIAVVEQKKAINRVLFGINAVAIAYLIWCTKSRTALVVSLLFSLYTVPGIRSKYTKPLIRMAPLIPIMFAAVLILFQESLNQIVFMGDSFDTGRVSIFKQALESLDALTMIFGNYREYAAQNLHNIYISILVEYGITVAILFGILMWSAGNREYAGKKNGSAVLAKVGFALVMVFSSTEAAFYIGGSLYAGFVFVLHYLSLPMESYEV